MTRARDLAAFVSNADGDIKFDTDTLFIDSSANRVGIKDTTPDNVFNIKESALSGRGASNGNTSMTLEHATDTGIQFFSATQTQLRFGDAASTGSGSLIYTHSDDVLKFSTAGSERLRIDDEGLKFNADTAAANALDDYEEGTWTPVITPELGSAASITLNHASYTKIGRLVYVVFDLRIDSISGTSSSAAIELTGLPFTRDVSFGGGTNVNYSGLTASMTGTLALQGNSTTKYRIVNSMGTTSQNASDHLTSNSILRAQFSYHAA